VVRRRAAYAQGVTRTRLAFGLAPILVALILSVGFAAAAPPPGKGQPSKHHSVSVGIAYNHGVLVLSTDKAGRAQIVIRSADGRRHWLKTVKLQVPTTALSLKKVFPHITSGRYRVVVRPLFDDGFLSGAWIVVH
jgi:hypothetical protein